MSRGRIALAVLVLVIIGIAVWWWFGRGEDVETATVERGQIDVTIQTIGTIRASDQDVLRVQESGTVAQIGARPGDLVEPGDIVIGLERDRFDRNVRDAERQLESAEYALQQAEVQADQEPESSERQFAVISAQERVDAARRGLEDAQNALSQSVVVATERGIMLELLVSHGDPVSPSQTVARLYQPREFELIADVDELDLPNVAPGAEVRFRLDAFPSEELVGVVVRTSPQARQEGGTTVFSSTVEFDAGQDLDIRPGMNADVTIVTDARSDVLVVPERAIRSVGDRAFVTVVEDGESEEVEVILGHRGGGLVEVVSGLSEGETVELR